ncbi:MAG: PfkB family carbohydrate kinase [Daejeonella sp.]
MKKLLVIGSYNADMVVTTQRFPKPGETIIGESFMMNPGGKGANQAVAAARFDAPVTFITCLGTDLFGNNALRDFKTENIDARYIFTDAHQPSGTALITVDSQGENNIVVIPGANNSLTIDRIKTIEHIIPEFDYLLMQLEIPLETVAYIAFMAKNKGKRVILNPAPARGH